MATLSGKTALKTGASRGIGRATAKAIAAAGARVIGHYGQSAGDAGPLVAEIRAAGGLADAVGADLATTDGQHALAAKVREVVGDRLDVVLANAGVSRTATVEETTMADFDRLFAVHVRAPFFLVQQLLPLLGEGASVVFVTSVVARAVVGNQTAYAATEGGARHDGEAPGYSPRPAWDLGECCRPGDGRDRHVELHPNRGRAAVHSGRSSGSPARTTWPGGSPATPFGPAAGRNSDAGVPAYRPRGPGARHPLLNQAWSQ